MVPCTASAATHMEAKNPNDFDRKPGHDALCFTAGPQGAYFGAGVIHAYLAADREPPVVVAGISAGSLTAAAMYKAYSELKASDVTDGHAREVARWKWFRFYLETLTYEPLAPIWDALPNPEDFLADTLPVQDPSCPDELREDETSARADFHRLMRLGTWFGGLPVRISDVADLIVRWIRFKEGYANPAWQLLMLVYRIVTVMFQVAVYSFWEADFRRSVDPKTGKSTMRKPLLGSLWFATAAWVVAQAASVVALLVSPSKGRLWLAIGLALVPGLATIGVILRTSIMDGLINLVGRVIGREKAGKMMDPLRRTLVDRLPGNLVRFVGIGEGILNKYHLKLWLRRIFDATQIQPHNAGPFQLLLVGATLELDTGTDGQKAMGSAQVWARSETKLDEALTATLSVPGLFAPETVPANKWVKDGDPNKTIRVVDGAIIRANPIPALFGWLANNANETDSVAWKLFHEAKQGVQQKGAALQVVYSVPLRGLSREEEIRREEIDIVESATMGLRLQRRRDTEMESRQTEFMSELNLEARRGAAYKDDKGKPRFPIFPNPISPVDDLRFANPFRPTRKEGLEQVAQGCRRTLESLYRNRLRELDPRQVACIKLMREQAPQRMDFLSFENPGVAEVCRECSGLLEVREVETSQLDRGSRSYGTALAKHERFPELVGGSRIAFIANGGVFRGSFHAGVAAGLRWADVKPNLIVGSSVGAIVGGAVAVTSRIPDDEAAYRHLIRLADVFLRCDQQVALTRRLKSIAKQLGVRARAIHVSPADVRKRIEAGSRRDSAYAITGAPPILIDAISELFLIPHETTKEIAAKFVSGKLSLSAKLFFQAIREETLRRLGIEEYLMGSELLEKTASDLLFPKEVRHVSRAVQPYHTGIDDDLHNVAVFATATLVSRRGTVLLGQQFPSEVPVPKDYAFLEACLASAAFPVAFSTRSTSQLLPGRGRTDALLSDGGIFDNLPFFPALDVLYEMQVSAGKDSSPEEAYRDLKARNESPVLMIAAGLDAPPGAVHADNPWDFLQLANAKKADVKVDSFQGTSEVVYEMTSSLLEAFAPNPQDIDPRFVNSIVPASILKIMPLDTDHLNGTFAFCRALGLTEAKMRASIAHGCFQTLAQFAQGTPNSENLRKSFESLDLIDRITWQRETPAASDHCPHFRMRDASKRCPYTYASGDVKRDEAVRKIFEACKNDSVHLRIANVASEKART
jgi:predicted acylesterase/phospholipase RssA